MDLIKKNLKILNKIVSHDFLQSHIIKINIIKDEITCSLYMSENECNMDPKCKYMPNGQCIKNNCASFIINKKCPLTTKFITKGEFGTISEIDTSNCILKMGEISPYEITIQNKAADKGITYHAYKCKDSIGNDGFVMKRINGETLSKYIMNNFVEVDNKYKFSSKLKIFEANEKLELNIIDIIVKLVNINIKHNDLHGSNLMIEKPYNIRVIDFGKSKIIKDDYILKIENLIATLHIIIGKYDFHGAEDNYNYNNDDFKKEIYEFRTRTNLFAKEKYRRDLKKKTIYNIKITKFPLILNYTLKLRLDNNTLLEGIMDLNKFWFTANKYISYRLVLYGFIEPIPEKYEYIDMSLKKMGINNFLDLQTITEHDFKHLFSHVTKIDKETCDKITETLKNIHGDGEYCFIFKTNKKPKRQIYL